LTNSPEGLSLIFAGPLAFSFAVIRLRRDFHPQEGISMLGAP
jgi:hypothetical protein